MDYENLMTIRKLDVENQFYTNLRTKILIFNFQLRVMLMQSTKVFENLDLKTQQKRHTFLQPFLVSYNFRFITFFCENDSRDVFLNSVYFKIYQPLPVCISGTIVI